MTTNTDTSLTVVPFQISRTEFSVFVVLQEANLERIKAYDPAEVPIAKLLLTHSGLKLRDVVIGYATDEDLQEFMRLVGRGRVDRGLRHLSRGFRFRPDMGDHDNGPQPLRPEVEGRRHQDE